MCTLVRYVDAFVVMCDTAEACEEAELEVREVLEDELGLELHPDKTSRTPGDPRQHSRSSP